MSSAGTTTLYNTLVALNTAGAGKTATPATSRGTVSAASEYNLVGVGGSGGLTSTMTNQNQLNIAAPGLAPGLADNGGPTQTIALVAGSPAIDAARRRCRMHPLTTSAVPSAASRPRRPTSGSAPDIGAYEASSEYLVTVPTTTNDAPTPDSTDVGTLRAAVLWANVSTNANPSNVTGLVPNTIVFAPSVTGTITLTLGALALNNTNLPIVITGPGATVLSISGDNLSGVFAVAGGTTASMSGLTVTGGSVATGERRRHRQLRRSHPLERGRHRATRRSQAAASPTSKGGCWRSSTQRCRTTRRPQSGGGLVNAGSATITHDTFSNNSAHHRRRQSPSRLAGSGSLFDTIV